MNESKDRLTSFFTNRKVIIAISLIWGFGLALLFRKICTEDQCTIVKVPPILYSQNNGVIVDKNNRCYKLEKYPIECSYGTI